MRVFLLAMVLSGCATTAGYEKMLETYRNHPVWQLEEQWGKPSKILEDGTYRYVYLYGSSGMGYYSPDYNAVMVNTRQNYCLTDFMVKAGIITGWRYEGNRCRY